VDAGAQRALMQGRSLLAAGVERVTGHFERGDAVKVESLEGSELGRGLTNYAAEEARAIAGHQSRDIENILGYRGRDEMIHRDDLVLSQQSSTR
jgi:glutamate 5-kinase